MYKEIFVKIEGYDDYYISNEGRVMSTKNNKIKYLTTLLVKGYLFVILFLNKKRKTKYIHRLIAEHFIANPNNFSHVDHIDQNITNNNINNLRWITHQKNLWNSSKAKGYWKHKDKWRASIMIDRKNKHLGLFNTEEEAHAAYLAAKEKYHIIN
jgi:hypothetical protein